MFKKGPAVRVRFSFLQEQALRYLFLKKCCISKYYAYIFYFLIFFSVLENGDWVFCSFPYKHIPHILSLTYWPIPCCYIVVKGRQTFNVYLIMSKPCSKLSLFFLSWKLSVFTGVSFFLFFFGIVFHALIAYTTLVYQELKTSLNVFRHTQYSEIGKWYKSFSPDPSDLLK